MITFALLLGLLEVLLQSRAQMCARHVRLVHMQPRRGELNAIFVQWGTDVRQAPACQLLVQLDISKTRKARRSVCGVAVVNMPRIMHLQGA